MWWGVLGLLLALACATPAPRGTAVALRRAPAPAADPLELEISPRALAARVGEPVVLRLTGAGAPEAECHWAGGGERGPEIRLPAASVAGFLDVECRSDGAQASAEISYSAARVSPLPDPYAGAVALLKARRTPRAWKLPEGTQALDLGTFDARLEEIGAFAFPAFPFDRSGTLDRVGISRWIAVAVPEGVNLYQALELLRADPQVEPGSLLLDDAGFVFVSARSDWPAWIEATSGRSGELEDVYEPASASTAPGAVGWDLEAIGAPEAWKRSRQGSGVGIAVVDSGIDVNHLAIAPNLRPKSSERAGVDGDRNGIPGDELGVNFAHLAIARSSGPPRLGLGLASDLSDWDGADSGRDGRRWGHGTALAAIAAGAGGAGGRVGVAPRAWLLAVDVQENFRTSASSLIDADPRMREAPFGAGARPLVHQARLRSSDWSRAAGVAYAVAEGAGVVTCAWEGVEPHWLLHDALLYAEDNCVVAVCGLDPQAGDGGHPARWHSRERGQDTGATFDGWTGAFAPDFFERPLRGLIVAGSARSAGAAAALLDLVGPSEADGSSELDSAVSNPRNDQSPALDRRTAPFDGSAMSVGLAAGAAALLRAERPDLEPRELRSALVEGAGPYRHLWLPGALEAARSLPKGSCQRPEERRERATAASEPLWRRIRVRVSTRPRDPAAPPAGPAEH